MTVNAFGPSIVLALLLGIGVAHHADAQQGASKPIRMIVGFVPGGGTDIAARLISQRLTEVMAQPVIVENRPGASGAIAIERVTKSLPDGTTLLMQVASSTIPSALQPNLPYDLKRDLAPISMVAVGPYLLVVHPSVPARSAKDLIALARAQPGKLNYGSSGAGSAAHLASELFNSMAKLNVVHVPYKGGGDFVVALAAGQIDMVIVSIGAVTPFLPAGKLRALAVSSATRTSLMPAMPTINESGLPGYERSGWYGVFAPAGMPKTLVSQLNSAIGKAVNSPEMVEPFTRQGFEPKSGTPEQLGAFLDNEMAQNVKLVKLIGLKAE